MTWRSAFRLAGIALSVACLVYFTVSAAHALDSAGTHLGLRTILVGIATALPPYAVGYALFALVWHLLLKGLGTRVDPATTFGIFFVSQFGKYLPGNVAHHAGRVLLSKRFGYALTPVGAAMALETLVTVAAAAVLSIPLAASLGALLGRLAAPGTILAAVLAALIVVSCVVWILIRRGALRHLAARLGPIASSLRLSNAVPLLMKSLLLAVSAIILCAGSLGILGAGSVMELQSSYFHVVALFSVAWIAGLLTPGAPAGLGVREVILMEGLSSHFGPAGATAAAIMFRLLTVTADLLALAVGTVLLRAASNRDRNATRSS